MAKDLLGGLSAADFLGRYWQKKPLLVRDALPELETWIDRKMLVALAAREDLESRLVLHDGRRWRVRHGPLAARTFDRLRGRKWSLLVQGIERALPDAWGLMERFSFIPRARLDDVMVSFAPPGGGVGPHFDSYDVFLAQGAGRRRWRIGRARPADLVASAPLRILRNFRPRREFDVAPGDLLYLPPNYGHDGIATTDCITISIGFRAPGAQELGVRFLEFLQERLRMEGRYEDPDLREQRRPAMIAPAMIAKACRMLRDITWDRGDVAECLGRHLTEPKPEVLYSRPAHALSVRSFAGALSRRGARLAPATRMLFHDRMIFINGESCAMPPGSAGLLRRLADRRRLGPGPAAPRPARDCLYEWYRAGYILLDEGGG